MLSWTNAFFPIAITRWGFRLSLQELNHPQASRGFVFRNANNLTITCTKRSIDRPEHLLDKLEIPDRSFWPSRLFSATPAALRLDLAHRQPNWSPEVLP